MELDLEHILDFISTVLVAIAILMSKIFPN